MPQRLFTESHPLSSSLELQEFRSARLKEDLFIPVCYRHIHFLLRHHHNCITISSCQAGCGASKAAGMAGQAIPAKILWFTLFPFDHVDTFPGSKDVLHIDLHRNHHFRWQDSAMSTPDSLHLLDGPHITVIQQSCSEFWVLPYTHVCRQRHPTPLLPGMQKSARGGKLGGDTDAAKLFPFQPTVNPATALLPRRGAAELSTGDALRRILTRVRPLDLQDPGMIQDPRPKPSA